MIRTPTLPAIRQALAPLSTLLAGALLAASAWAGTPFISGPSVTKASAPTQFQGSGFAPNAAVTVMIKSPSGTASGHGAVTGAAGELRYTLVAAQAGPYTLTVTDSGGRALATATVAVLP